MVDVVLRQSKFLGRVEPEHLQIHVGGGPSPGSVSRARPSDVIDSGTPQIAGCSRSDRAQGREFEVDHLLVDEHRRDDRRERQQAADQHPAAGSDLGEALPPGAEQASSGKIRTVPRSRTPSRPSWRCRTIPRASPAPIDAEPIRTAATLKAIILAFGRGVGPEHLAVDVVRQSAGHADEQAGERRHERRETPPRW